VVTLCPTFSHFDSILLDSIFLVLTNNSGVLEIMENLLIFFNSSDNKISFERPRNQFKSKKVQGCLPCPFEIHIQKHFNYGVLKEWKFVENGDCCEWKSGLKKVDSQSLSTQMFSS